MFYIAYAIIIDYITSLLLAHLLRSALAGHLRIHVDVVRSRHLTAQLVYGWLDIVVVEILGD